jgi:aspartate/methionine/tyrosine aminotransferase
VRPEIFRDVEIMEKPRETRFELARWITKMAYSVKYNLGSTETQGRVANGYYPPKDIKIGGGTWEGDHDLKEMLAKRYKVKPQNIAITAGASEANFLIGFAMVGMGKKRKKPGTVLIENPIYSPLWGIGDILGAKIKRWNRRFEDGFQLDLEALKGLVKGVDLIVLTNLHNPSGAAIPPKDMKAASEIASDAGAMIHCDEVFRDFAPEITQPTAWAGDNCITTCSISKFQGMGGVKVGWTVASEENTKKIWTVREMTSCTCSRIDEEMMKIILKDEKIGKESRAIAKRNIALVKMWVQSQDKVAWVESNGGMCFPKIKGLRSSVKFAEYMLKKYDTLVSPGYFFGLEGHVRIGLGGPGDVLQGGLERLSKALKKDMASFK